MIIVHAQLLEAPTVGYEEDNCSPWITSNDLTVLRTSRSYVDKALALPIPPAEGAARIWAEKIPYLLSDRFYHGDDLVSKLYQQFCSHVLAMFIEMISMNMSLMQGAANFIPRKHGLSYFSLRVHNQIDHLGIVLGHNISNQELRSRAKVDVIDQAPLTQTTMERKMTKPKTDAVGSFCSEFDVEIRGQKRSRKSGHFRKLPYGELHCQGECYTNRKTSFFKDVKLRTSGMTTSCSKSVRIHMIRRVYATARKARDILEACHIRPTRGHHGTNLNPPK
ncbi:hypothetical protein Tco_1314937 [Tanacetum coccineum]